MSESQPSARRDVGGLIAITREVPASLARCELTHVARAHMDLSLARAQHAEYERALAACGCRVIRGPELPDFPDSVFVEDAAVVLDEVAVLTRPGAPSRRGEVEAVAMLLSAHRPLAYLTEPATLDGGDVLRLDRVLWVGRSSRTNQAGISQLAAITAPFGYTVREAAMTGALHLKTAVTQIADNILLVNPEWVGAEQFGDCDVVHVHPREPFAANAVWVNGKVVHSTAFPLTQQRLRERGIQLIAVDASELAKAEGGVTCCSLIFGTAKE